MSNFDELKSPYGEGFTVLEQQTKNEHLSVSAEEKLMTLAEVATFLNVSPGTVRRWTNEGKLPCYRLGGSQGSRRFVKEDILKFLKANQESQVQQ